MQEFIDYIVKQFVSLPEKVVIKETNMNGLTSYLIEVDQADMGLIIGKGGKTIRSIRSLVKAKSIKDGVRIRIDLVDPKTGEGNYISSENIEDKDSLDTSTNDQEQA